MTLPVPDKMWFPQATADPIARPRLVTRLAAAQRPGSVILICAPAGSGKTTLAREWLRSLADTPNLAATGAPTRGVWVTCDAADNDLLTFLEDLLAALRACAPELATEMRVDLTHDRQVAAAPVMDALLTSIAMQPYRLALVFDDYHLIEAADVHEAVRRILRGALPNLCVLISTRSEPPLELAERRVRRQLVELRAQDLRFTTEETLALLRAMVGNGMTQATAGELARRTEGWAMGLRLAGISLRNAPEATLLFAELPETSQQQIAEYLTGQVLARQRPEIQRFLLETSALERLEAGLCAAVLGDIGATECQALLERLEREGLFLTPEDDHRGRYRYHAVFRSVLQQHLHAHAEPGTIRRLHERATTWLAADGDLREAMGHALAAGDEGRAAALVEQSLELAIEGETWDTLEQGLSRLPETLAAARPGLLLARAWVMEWRFQHVTAAALVEQAERLLEGEPGAEWAPDEVRWRGQVAALRASHLFAHRPVAERLAYADQALALLPERNRVRTFALGAKILALQESGRGAEALALFQTADAAAGPDASPYRAFLALDTAIACYQEGWLAKLVPLGEQMLWLAGACDLPGVTAWAHIGLGEVHFQAGRDAEAAAHFDTVLENPRRAHHQALAVALHGLARAWQAQSSEATGRRIRARLREVAAEARGDEMDANVASVEAFLELVQGDVASALRWANAPSQAPETVSTPEWHITRAEIWLAEGSQASLRAASDALRKNVTAIGSYNMMRQQIRYRILLALALWGQGRWHEALDDLEVALDLAAPRGFVRWFVAGGPAMGAMLHTLARSDRHVDEAVRILAQIPHGLVTDSLTAREREVLQLLGQGRSNKEIARTLEISPLTARNHTASIFRKLGVADRREVESPARRS